MRSQEILESGMLGKLQSDEFKIASEVINKNAVPIASAE